MICYAESINNYMEHVAEMLKFLCAHFRSHVERWPSALMIAFDKNVTVDMSTCPL